MFVKSGAFLINLALVSHVEVKSASLLLHFVGPANHDGQSLELTGRNRESLLKVIASGDDVLGRHEAVPKEPRGIFGPTSNPLARFAAAVPR